MTEPNTALHKYALRLGDDALITGHRLSEWCGHGPTLEEDIALANIALDCLGQANALLALAGEAEGTGRSQDDLAYLRDAVHFRNALLLELPKGDFGFTIVRQFLYAAYAYPLYEALQQASHETLAGIAAKAVKEVRYHLRHTSEWVIRLGDGTDESHRRAQNALDACWRYTGELFEADAVTEAAQHHFGAPDPADLHHRWQAITDQVLAQATLAKPADVFMQTGGRSGRHTEHLGHLLSEMQIVARSFPEAAW